MVSGSGVTLKFRFRLFRGTGLSRGTARCTCVPGSCCGSHGRFGSRCVSALGPFSGGRWRVGFLWWEGVKKYPLRRSCLPLCQLGLRWADLATSPGLPPLVVPLAGRRRPSKPTNGSCQAVARRCWLLLSWPVRNDLGFQEV